MISEYISGIMKSKIINGIVILVDLININCGSTKEITEIKPMIIHPPVIEDSIKATSNNDSVIVGMIVKNGQIPYLKNDTIVVVKYFPKLEKFYIKAKPDSIIIMDTLRSVQTIEKITETPFLSKMGLVMAGIIITIIGSYLLRRRG
jgi:hypothetical protein